MKKKFVLSLLLSSCLFQLDAASDQTCKNKKHNEFYGGIGLVESLTSSTFKMNYESSDPFVIPYVEHKKNNISKLSPELFVGFRHNFSNCWFYAAELSYNFGKSTHKADFTQKEDAELDYINPSDERISYIRVKHGHELGLTAKIGRDAGFCDIYGILGLSTKKIDITFGLDDSNNFVDHPLEVSPSKRVYGLIIGVGASKRLNDHLSCSMEYKYKVYNSAKKQLDMRESVDKSFDYRNVTHDESDRTFKVHSDKHELSLRFSVNI